ncbi:serine/threonine-protein phosphatase 6 regulatory subunit 3-B [Battus philenor]|uniref:serine/threonine-protein phosphatase 6 regulatory subunit 3-B n=1 Tax=Battus philenor TaxID=42288 RepID=UPI0035CF8549
MFWSGNFIAVRELNNLLKEENVTLTQVLEADDILQECKADNKALILFLTKSEILAELVTLITEEPPKNVDLASQYRHAHIASEVLTSQLMMLSDRLSMDVVQMNRLCDFVNKDPPLNPLLASYYSKTIEMLLEKSPKQDWYLYHIVCLRVLDFFKSRRDFLPNLLRHISTSTIADIFKYFIRLKDPFNKIILEWLEEYQFLECLIHIVCGTYEHEEIRPVPVSDAAERSPEQTEKGQQETSEKVEMNHKEDGVDGNKDEKVTNDSEEQSSCKKRGAEAGRASANAAALLCDLLAFEPPGTTAMPVTSWSLVTRLRSEECVRMLLQCMFTSPPEMRRHAVVNGCQLLLALLTQDSASNANGNGSGGESTWSSASVQRAIAPHLPLLHQALLRPPTPLVLNTDENVKKVSEKAKDTDDKNNPEVQEQGCSDDNKTNENNSEGTHENSYEDCEADKQCDSQRYEKSYEPGYASTPAVGTARVHVAALIAQLAFSEVKDVHNALLTLGTPGVLIDMFFDYPQNNFLHTQVYIFIQNAMSNPGFADRYEKHLIDECKILTRLMDTYEENESKKAGAVRRGNMGHVVLALRCLEYCMPSDPAAEERWTAFVENVVRPLLQHHDTPLGGFYPSDNIYEYNEASASAWNESVAAMQFTCENATTRNEYSFLQVAGQRTNDGMWDDNAESDAKPKTDEQKESEAEAGPAWVREMLAEGARGFSAWDTEEDEETEGSEWANFGEVFATPVDPFAPVASAPPAQHQHGFDQEFTPCWLYNDNGNEHPGVCDATCQSGLQQSMQALNMGNEFKVKPMDEASTAELTNNLLTAMSSMAPDVIADIVSAMPQPDEPLTAPNSEEPSADR